MMVYTVFLFFSFFCISNDEYLSKITLAATLAGMFFAGSDTLLTPAQYFSTELSIIKKDILDMKSEILNRIAKEPAHSDKYNDCMQDVINTEARIDECNKHIKRLYIVGYIAFALGIFAFLTVITFYNTNLKLFAALLNAENRITILAFAFVVLNYLLQDLLVSKTQKDIDAIKNTQEEKPNGKNANGIR